MEEVYVFELDEMFEFLCDVELCLFELELVFDEMSVEKGEC